MIENMLKNGNCCRYIVTILVAGILVYPGRSEALQAISLPVFEVSKSNINEFSTPIAYYDGEVYVAAIEPAVGAETGINLRTVIRKGMLNRKGQWIWETHVLDDATLDDPYHTQPSIAVDKDGYVHVAYNMHNMPWQYSVSTKPKDISSFEFKGEKVSVGERDIVKHLNKSPFPSLGRASIPGNQITYPAFFYDQNKDIYITYRFATRPKKPFEDRGFAGGIARYDTVKKQWQALGGDLLVSDQDADLPRGVSSATIKTFAYTDNWSVYLLRLAFDKINNMHITWTWREGGAGRYTSDATYAYSADDGKTFMRANGSKYNLPVDHNSADLLMGKNSKDQFNALTSIASDVMNYPFVVVQNTNGRFLVNYKGEQWSKPESMPYGASKLVFDNIGDQWIFASDPMVLCRNKNNATWIKMYQAIDHPKFIYSKVMSAEEENLYVIYSHSVDLTKAKIIIIKREPHENCNAKYFAPNSPNLMRTNKHL